MEAEGAHSGESTGRPCGCGVHTGETCSMQLGRSIEKVVAGQTCYFTRNGLKNKVACILTDLGEASHLSRASPGERRYILAGGRLSKLKSHCL